MILDDFFHYGRVISNESKAIREGKNLLVAGDIIMFYKGIHWSSAAPMFLIRFINPNGLEYLPKSYIEPMSPDIIPKGVVVGARVKLKYIGCYDYNDTFTVLEISNGGLMKLRPESYNPKMHYTDGFSMAPAFCVSLADEKCVCNFYEREAYGCRCGRIVG